MGRLGRALRGAPPEQIYKDTAGFVGFLQGPSSPAPDAAALVETEQINPTIARCIDVISEDAASVPMRLFDVRSGKPRELEQHAALELFRSVNPVDTPSIFFRTVYADLLTEGNSFAFLERDAAGIPIKAIRLPPEEIEVVPDRRTIIGGYKWKRPGVTKPEEYTADQIMHVRTRNPASPYRGMGKLVRLRDQILLERAMRQWKLNQFLNGIPTGVVITADRMVAGEADWDRFQQEFWQRMKGPKNSGKPLFLRKGEVAVQVLPRPTEDELGFIRMLEHLRREYSMLFGVPPSRLSDYSESFRANASEQGRTYWQDTIMQWHRLVLDYLNSTFLPRWFPDARPRAGGQASIAFAYDYSKVRALALSQRDQAQLNEILIRNGMRTPNEAAVAMGDPAHDDPAANDLYMNGKPLGETSGAPEGTPPGPATGPGGEVGATEQGSGAEGQGAAGLRPPPKNGKERRHARS